MARVPSTDSSRTALREHHCEPQTNRFPQLSLVARQQLGVLSRVQLGRYGVSLHQIEHEIDVGRWSSVAPGVVALQNAALTREQRAWLGPLHTGRPAVLTHATACEYGGLRWTQDETIHVLTAKGDLVTPLDGFRFHQTRRPFEDWAVPGAGPPRLDIEHAVLLASERDRYIRRAVGRIAAAVQQGLSTPEQLLVAAATVKKLRNGAIFKLALGDIAGGAQSFAEIDIGTLCREAGIRPPDRQTFRLDRDGRRRYLDCTWRLSHERMLVLEIDGSFHLLVENWWRDKKRERSLVSWDRLVLRCSSPEIRLEPQGIIDDLVAMGVPRAHPRFVQDRSA